MAKPSKQFKKFASSGKLKETIQKRRSVQQSKRKFDEKLAQRSKQRGKPADEGVSDDEEDDEGANARDMKKAGTGGRAGGVARTVDELFSGDGGLAGPPDAPEDEDEEDDLSEGSGDEEESEMGEELERDEEAMKKAMKDLEKKDPEFFKYLAENDKSLLDFGDAGEEDEDEDMEDGDEEDEDMEDDDDDEEDGGEEEEEVVKKVVVTGKMLRQWQEGMLRLHSLKSLRSTLLAFRAAAHMNEEETEGAGGTKYAINSPAVFNKLVITALKFTPVVLAHHIPYKTQRDGRLKVSQPKKPNPRLTRLILSHFSTLLHFIRTLPSRPAPGTEDEEESAGGLLLVALSESSKLVPWVLGARKHVRAYLKALLELWSSASDNVRIAAFLAVRKLFVGADDAIRDICLKNTYRALLAPLRHTTPHSLPSLNLLKNTASELFLLNQPIAYPHAFTAIRMLGVHLRDCIRDVTAAPSTRGATGADAPPKKDVGQEAFKKVYNWQFVHTIDFWCRTLGAGCSKEAELERGGVKSELEPLVYPLVQIALGVIRLLPSPRYFPLRFHILHSLLSLSSKTGIYIPLTPYLLEILDSADFRSSGKKSTLKPLDLEYVIRAPQAYPRTRIYQEVIGEELVYLLASFHALYSAHIAFPEITLPAILTIKRHLKKGTAGAGKTANQFKVLVEKLEEGRRWIETRRRGVGFAPRDRAEVGRWEEGLGGQGKTPVGVWRATLGKARERKRGEVERALREEK